MYLPWGLWGLDPHSYFVDPLSCFCKLNPEGVSVSLPSSDLSNLC